MMLYINVGFVGKSFVKVILRLLKLGGLVKVMHSLDALPVDLKS